MLIEWLRRWWRGLRSERSVTGGVTLVYVHGAGDRAAGVDDHVARIGQGLAAAGLAFDVVPSRWGEAVGPTLDRIHLAVPGGTPPAAQAALAAGTAPEQPLNADPLAGLQALAVAAAGSGDESSPEDPPATAQAEARTAHPEREADQLLMICRAHVGREDDLIARPDGSVTSLAEACHSGAVTVARSAEYASAHGAPASEMELVAATGRAVAATAAGGAMATAATVERVQQRIAEAVLTLAGGTLLAGYLGIDVGPALKRWATDTILPHRSRLMREVLGVADILAYQRNGDPMRRFVAATITSELARRRPVVAFGNSLGGIVLVDTLAEMDGPGPDLLVTVGSQAPALATFGALHPHDAPGGRPPFQPWLNIYDRRDLLGFVARPVWPDEAGITDVEVDSGLGFPDSHGATPLANPQIYRLIADHPALRRGA